MLLATLENENALLELRFHAQALAAGVILSLTHAAGTINISLAVASRERKHQVGLSLVKRF